MINKKKKSYSLTDEKCANAVSKSLNLCSGVRSKACSNISNLSPFPLRNKTCLKA